MNPFVERHQASISSTLSCFNRIVVTGTLPDICHPRAMAGFLDYHKVRLFDLMFKVLILQTLYNLADEQVEYQIKDRLYFVRFLGLGIEDSVHECHNGLVFLRAAQGTGVAGGFV